MGNSKNLLMVEIDERVADIVTGYVDEIGHQAVWVRDYDSAVIALQNFTFSAGILGLVLAKGSGADLLPLNFPVCIYTALPESAPAIPKVPIFSKGYPYALFRWIESVLKREESSE